MATPSTARDTQVPIVVDNDWEAEREPGNKSDNSSYMLCSGTSIKPTQFDSSRQTLLSALELSQSFQKAIRDGHSLARHMNLPLMSDILAEKISHLFSDARPHVLEREGDKNDDITWVDVIREGSFHAEQQNERYRFRLRNREALFEMTQFDYDLILSGLPWKLVHPQSHANDIVAEISAIDLMVSEMRMWKGIAAKISETIDDTLTQLTAKLKRIEDLDIPLEWTTQESAPLAEVNAQDTTPSRSSNEAPGPKSSGRKRRSLPRGRRWTAEEKDRLPEWFKQRAGLPENDIQNQFKQEFGHYRSFAAIQAMLYQEGAGHLCRKKRNKLCQNTQTAQPSASDIAMPVPLSTIVLEPNSGPL